MFEKGDIVVWWASFHETASGGVVLVGGDLSLLVSERGADRTLYLDDGPNDPVVVGRVVDGKPEWLADKFRKAAERVLRNGHREDCNAICGITGTEECSCGYEELSALVPTLRTSAFGGPL